ncbi:hypothetical protein GGR54DRAFT_626150 [Hypoxylon sp. NC1633]|nr:hypothetical protein GGR54DRAFT_626150 [Hypoxylon sp. NC1633]
MLDLLLQIGEQTREAKMDKSNWLDITEKSIQEDLEASRRELELIRDVLEEMKISTGADLQPNNRLGDQMFLMRACQEYSGSRCHMLEERIRQVQSWLSSMEKGKKIPDRVPSEWSMVDIEWRQWLSEQATPQINEFSQVSIGDTKERGLDAAVIHWGPLIPLLTTYLECKEAKRLPRNAC